VYRLFPQPLLLLTPPLTLPAVSRPPRTDKGGWWADNTREDGIWSSLGWQKVKRGLLVIFIFSVHPLPCQILLLNWHQECSYRPRNQWSQSTVRTVGTVRYRTWLCTVSTYVPPCPIVCTMFIYIHNWPVFQWWYDPRVPPFLSRPILIHNNGQSLSGGIILGSLLSHPDLFLDTITLPAVSCDAPPTLSYTTLEMASRVLLSYKKPAKTLPTVSCDAQPTLSYTALEMASRVLFLSRNQPYNCHVWLTCSPCIHCYRCMSWCSPLYALPNLWNEINKSKFLQMQHHQIAVRNSLFKKIDWLCLVDRNLSLT
jgi:hypothetical protein